MTTWVVVNPAAFVHHKSFKEACRARRARESDVIRDLAIWRIEPLDEIDTVQEQPRDREEKRQDLLAASNFMESLFDEKTLGIEKMEEGGWKVTVGDGFHSASFHGMDIFTAREAALKKMEREKAEMEPQVVETTTVPIKVPELKKKTSAKGIKV